MKENEDYSKNTDPQFDSNLVLPNKFSTDTNPSSTFPYPHDITTQQLGNVSQNDRRAKVQDLQDDETFDITMPNNAYFSYKERNPDMDVQLDETDKSVKRGQAKCTVEDDYAIEKEDVVNNNYLLVKVNENDYDDFKKTAPRLTGKNEADAFFKYHQKYDTLLNDNNGFQKELQQVRNSTKKENPLIRFGTWLKRKFKKHPVLTVLGSILTLGVAAGVIAGMVVGFPEVISALAGAAIATKGAIVASTTTIALSVTGGLVGVGAGILTNYILKKKFKPKTSYIDQAEHFEAIYLTSEAGKQKVCGGSPDDYNSVLAALVNIKKDNASGTSIALLKHLLGMRGAFKKTELLDKVVQDYQKLVKHGGNLKGLTKLMRAYILACFCEGSDSTDAQKHFSILSATITKLRKNDLSPDEIAIIDAISKETGNLTGQQAANKQMQAYDYDFQSSGRSMTNDTADQRNQGKIAFLNTFYPPTKEQKVALGNHLRNNGSLESGHEYLNMLSKAKTQSCFMMKLLFMAQYAGVDCKNDYGNTFRYGEGADRKDDELFELFAHGGRTAFILPKKQQANRKSMVGQMLFSHKRNQVPGLVPKEDKTFQSRVSTHGFSIKDKNGSAKFKEKKYDKVKALGSGISDFMKNTFLSNDYCSNTYRDYGSSFAVGGLGKKLGENGPISQSNGQFGEMFVGAMSETTSSYGGLLVGLESTSSGCSNGLMKHKHDASASNSPLSIFGMSCLKNSSSMHNKIGTDYDARHVDIAKKISNDPDERIFFELCMEKIDEIYKNEFDTETTGMGTIHEMLDKLAGKKLDEREFNQFCSDYLGCEQ